MRSFLLSSYTLWKREFVRFLRQPSRLASALLQPLVFWLFVGAGLSPSFKPAGISAGISYLEYFYPGILLMTLLFTSMFSMFSIIEDRERGFLQAVLVSPAPRLSLIFGKVFGGATIGLLEAVVFLFLAPSIGIHLSLFSIFPVLAVLFLIAAVITMFGFSIAWQMDSFQAFHAIMMLILFPLWFLSGAFFPLDGLPKLLEWLTRINPLTYALSALRGVLYEKGTFELPPLCISLLVTISFGLVTFFISWYSTCRKRLR
ncbi:MAG: ABC transporter permease [Deltaproteobacteria bacterium]